VKAAQVSGKTLGGPRRLLHAVEFALSPHISCYLHTVDNLIFIDSRDLIECVERHVPCGVVRLATELRKRNTATVLSFSNLLEVIPRKQKLSYACEFANRLERIPHVFVPHTHVSTFEFNEAVAAFKENRPPRHVLQTFDSYGSYVCTFAPGPPPPPEWVAEVSRVSLSDHVRALLTDGESIELDEHETHRAAMQKVLDQHRSVLGSKRTNKKLLAEMVENQLAEQHLDVDNFGAFFEWLYRDPQICPGWRLLHEVFQEFRTDSTAFVSQSDVPDFTHIYLVPYVRAATLDRKWREYVRRASQRLVREGIAVSYPVYRNLAEVRSALARAA